MVARLERPDSAWFSVCHLHNVSWQSGPLSFGRRKPSSGNAAVPSVGGKAACWSQGECWCRWARPLHWEEQKTRIICLTRNTLLLLFLFLLKDMIPHGDFQVHPQHPWTQSMCKMVCGVEQFTQKHTTYLRIRKIVLINLKGIDIEWNVLCLQEHHFLPHKEARVIFFPIFVFILERPFICHLVFSIKSTLTTQSIVNLMNTVITFSNYKVIW